MNPASGDLRKDLQDLFVAMYPKLVSYFRRCGRDDAVADDLAQETFINALKGLSAFLGDSKLSTWVWAIARNVLLAHLRSNKHQIAEGPDGPVDPDTLTTGHDQHLMGMCDCVRRGFKRFAAEHPERAQAIYLAAVEGWTREELAAHLGRSVHAATEYLSQCKLKLRPFIEGCDGN